mmetsp:Transcript_2180/g.3107  ORF Transcript_2180/g.3107 Transcript_2180/m.3107 type:complete len:163 (-) Transcript_2180:302-790(-)
MGCSHEQGPLHLLPKPHLVSSAPCHIRLPDQPFSTHLPWCKDKAICSQRQILRNMQIVAFRLNLLLLISCKEIPEARGIFLCIRDICCNTLTIFFSSSNLVKPHAFKNEFASIFGPSHLFPGPGRMSALRNIAFPSLCSGSRFFNSNNVGSTAANSLKSSFR